MKNNKGFSLVELIVVIAIMAILAAVAVIGVSVYIPRAQEANDKELLNIMSDALTSACLSEGIDQRDITASVSVDAEGKLVREDGNIVISINSTKLTEAQKIEIAKVFNSVLSDKNAKFNLVASKTLTYRNGAFGVSVVLGVQNGDKVYYYEADAEKAEAFSNSIFASNSMGIDTTLGIMAQVGSFAQNFLVDGGDSAALEAVLGSAEFSEAFAKYVGYDGDMADFYDWMAEEYPDPEEQAKLTSNALMLYSSEKSGDLSTESVKDLLGSGGAKNEILSNLSGPNPDTATAMAQTAAAYGLYTAFLYSQPDSYTKDGKNKAQLIQEAGENPLAVLSGLDDPDFQNYINNSSDADIKGYLAAMEMLNDASGTSNGQGGTAAGDILNEGFDTPWLGDMMDQATGN